MSVNHQIPGPTINVTKMTKQTFSLFSLFAFYDSCSICMITRIMNSQVCIGDEVIVDLENRLSGANSAIHWHGLHQRKTPWSDGVPMVTQCPIQNDNSFRYFFYASEVGTHYWHCHSGT